MDVGQSVEFCLCCGSVACAGCDVIDDNTGRSPVYCGTLVHKLDRSSGYALLDCPRKLGGVMVRYWLIRWN